MIKGQPAFARSRCTAHTPKRIVLSLAGLKLAAQTSAVVGARVVHGNICEVIGGENADDVGCYFVMNDGLVVLSYDVDTVFLRIAKTVGGRKGERWSEGGTGGDDDGEARREGFCGGGGGRNTHDGVASFEFKRLRLYTFL